MTQDSISTMNEVSSALSAVTAGSAETDEWAKKLSQKWKVVRKHDSTKSLLETVQLQSDHPLKGHLFEPEARIGRILVEIESSPAAKRKEVREIAMAEYTWQKSNTLSTSAMRWCYREGQAARDLQAAHPHITKIETIYSYHRDAVNGRAPGKRYPTLDGREGPDNTAKARSNAVQKQEPAQAAHIDDQKDDPMNHVAPISSPAPDTHLISVAQIIRQVEDMRLRDIRELRDHLNSLLPPAADVKPNA